MENIEQFLIQKIEELSFTEISKSDRLWTDKILDSITIVELVVAIEIQFGIKVPNVDIVVENFDSIDLIAEYIVKAKG
jgi:acyl carrier protein